MIYESILTSVNNIYRDGQNNLHFLLILIVLENNYGSFSYIISEKQGKIQLAVNYEINTSIIPSTSYEFLKNFFKMMIDNQSEKIILIKE